MTCADLSEPCHLTPDETVDASTVFDVRVRQQDAQIAWADDVSLRDILGASLVTFDHHIDPSDVTQPIEPKAVYLQYRSQDPVTGQVSEVVVPAELSLDVFVDPEMFRAPSEEEDIVEEDKDEVEEEDRRKLRMSEKGDPILMRAKPAPAPDPYFSALRNEMLLARASIASPPAQRPAEASGTTSSFLRAAGRDKYCPSRLKGIDSIIRNSIPKVVPSMRTETSEFPAVTSAGNENPDGMYEERPDSGNLRYRRIMTPQRQRDLKDFSAQMAVHIDRMPQLGWKDCHFDRSSQPRRGEPRRDSGDGWPTEQELTETSRCSTVDLTAPSPRTPDTLRSHSIRRRSQQRCRTGGLRAASRMVLCDLDPHLDNSEVVPTQRVHGNWPDGPRRQLARHFYGMSPSKIVLEDEKERLLERGSGELTAAGSALTARRAARRKALEHCFKQNGAVAHRVEVRFKNGNRPGRSVVSRHTERLHALEDAACRPDRKSVV